MVTVERDTAQKLAYTDDPRGQVALSRAEGFRISHPETLPLRVNVRDTGQICRRVVVTTTEDVWYEDAVSRVTVPAGFTCDLASVPRWVYCLVSPYDLVLPALLHDRLYAQQVTTRRYADFVMFSILEQLGSPWYVRYPVWLAIRVFGRRAWATHAERKAREAKHNEP